MRTEKIKFLAEAMPAVLKREFEAMDKADADEAAALDAHYA